jgi:hypothetical protein
MPIQLQGNNGIIPDVWGAGLRGLKTHAMPFEVGSNGAYRKTLVSGTMAAGLAANAEIWQLRWTDATRLCVINKVVLDGRIGNGVHCRVWQRPAYGGARFFCFRHWRHGWHLDRQQR